MKRTTIFLPEATLEWLRRAALKKRVSSATLIREAVESYLVAAPKKGLPSIAGKFASGHQDTADKVDALLWRHPHT